MTNRNKPKNSTIVKEALKNIEPVEPEKLDNLVKKYGEVALKTDPITGGFVFPDDLDKIQPRQFPLIT